MIWSSIGIYKITFTNKKITFVPLHTVSGKRLPSVVKTRLAHREHGLKSLFQLLANNSVVPSTMAALISSANIRPIIICIAHWSEGRIHKERAVLDFVSGGNRNAPHEYSKLEMLLVISIRWLWLSLFLE